MRNTIEQKTSVVSRKKSSILKNAVQIIVVTMLFIGVCSAQTQFALAVGGTGYDCGNSVAQTSDGGYIVTGACRLNLFLAKISSAGRVSWMNTVGGAYWDLGSSVAPTLDRGYIVTGATCSFGAGCDDLFLAKFNSSGDLIWAKTVGGTERDFGNSVVLTSDGGYIVTGATYIILGAGDYDLFLVKFNSSGDLIWAKTVGGTYGEWGNSVVQTSDGGYVVTGTTDGFGAGGDDLFLCKFNSSGDLTWAKTVGRAMYERGRSVEQASDGGYIVTGETWSFGTGGSDLFLVKFNSSGDLTWAKTVGGTYNDRGNSVALTYDGGYVVTGETGSFSASSDLFLVKFNSSGDLAWAKTVGEASDDTGYSVILTSDGGYIVTGMTESYGTGCDIFLGKFSSSGEIWDCPFVADCSPVVGSPSLSSVSISPTITAPSLSAVSCSPTVTSLSPTVTVICTDISEVLSKPNSFELTVSPNPFNSSCAIMICQQSRLHRDCAMVEVEIYDLQGRLVWNKPSDSDYIGATSLIKGGKPEAVPLNKRDVAKRQGVSASAQEVIWTPNETISSGVYLVSVTTDDGQQITKRIVYLK